MIFINGKILEESGAAYLLSKAKTIAGDSINNFLKIKSDVVVVGGIFC